MRCPTPTNFITMSTLELVAVSARLMGEFKENVFGVQKGRPDGKATNSDPTKGGE